MKSTICQSYSEHINTALKFFETLLCKLELEFGVEHSRLCRFNGEFQLYCIVFCRSCILCACVYVSADALSALTHYELCASMLVFLHSR